jgi:hypothetical protein
MQPTEVYSTLYYDAKIRQRVKEERGERKLSQGENLSLIKTVTLDMFAAETDEVKKEVAQMIRKLKEKREREKEEDEEEDESRLSERRPEAYQQYVHTRSIHALAYYQHHRALDDFAPLFGPILEDVSRDTGNAFMVLWAGPEPISGGAIQVSR